MCSGTSSSPASCRGCTSQSVQWGALAAFVAACYHTSLTQTNTTHSTKLNARLHTCLWFFGVLFHMTLYRHCSLPVIRSESLPLFLFCVTCNCVFAHYLSAFERFLHFFKSTTNTFDLEFQHNSILISEIMIKGFLPICILTMLCFFLSAHCLGVYVTIVGYIRAPPSGVPDPYIRAFPIALYSCSLSVHCS